MLWGGGGLLRTRAPRDGASGPRGLVFRVRRRPHPGRPGMSYISSAGIARGAPGYGTTCRKDVLGGVDVPVVPGAAGRASPMPRRQAQLREQVPARRAGRGRRVPAVDDHQAAPVPLALVLQLAAELAPAAVGDGAGQVPVADHAGHVEVFDDDGVGRADQAGAGAVQEVLPRVTDLPVGAGYLRRGLGPVGGPFPAASHPPLVASQPAGLALQVPGVGDLVTVTGHGEVGHAEIDADRAAG